VNLGKGASREVEDIQGIHFQACNCKIATLKLFNFVPEYVTMTFLSSISLLDLDPQYLPSRPSTNGIDFKPLIPDSPLQTAILLIVLDSVPPLIFQPSPASNTCSCVLLPPTPQRGNHQRAESYGPRTLKFIQIATPHGSRKINHDQSIEESLVFLHALWRRRQCARFQFPWWVWRGRYSSRVA
jgi:hypothetical protein